jgi:hypothetical protein
MRILHKLSKLELLEYALEGVITRRGTQSGSLTETEKDLLDSDIAEIKRRIKLVKLAEGRRAKP